MKTIAEILDGEPLKSIPFWDADKCAEVAQRVLKNRQLWVDRGHFYTMGAATYQDDPYNYPAVAEKYNSSIAKKFGDELCELATFLEEKLGITPAFQQGTGLPSFHVFDLQASGMVGHPHVDEPHERVLWADDVADTFSFTILLESPPDGAGLDMWLDHTEADIDRYAETGELPEPTYFPYTKGEFVIHSGLIPHRIANPAPSQRMLLGEYRITLQGHGATLKNGLTALYF